MIGVTQPRCVVVLATTRRVGYQLGLGLGKDVSFQVRHDKKIGDNYAIKNSMYWATNSKASSWKSYEV
ncbi:hypothetical protein Tco_0640547, partial [Tanacetum coccineum]